jgi:flagellar hook-basal body complex protein FliE
MGITPVNLVNSAEKAAASKPNSAASFQQSFASSLKDALNSVNESEQTANHMVTDLARGAGTEDLHTVMIAMQKADILLRTTVQVRDRVIGAYQEIMRMQI